MSLEPPTATEALSADSAAELRTPSEWSALDGVTVMDPDGWRGCRDLPAKSWDEPIDRAEWEQRLSVSSQLSRVTPSEVVEALSVVDRIALRLMRIKVYGTNPDERYAASTRRQWDRVLDEDDRDAWRRAARQVLADIALGDCDNMPAWPEYEVRHPEGDKHGAFDDVGDAVDFADKVWPGSKVFERTRVSVCTEWTEVTA